MLSIFHLSDIHYGHPINGQGNNQKHVLYQFNKDIRNQILTRRRNNIVIIFSGDLVYTATEKNYSDFFKEIIKPLLNLGVHRNNIIIAPGNHDLSRDDIPDAFSNVIKQCLEEIKEERINATLKQMQGKFKCFEKFCTDDMKYNIKDVLGYPLTTNEGLEIFCLNTSLCHTGGLDPLLDNQKQHIYNLGLYDWNQKNEDKMRILVMHHPLSLLSDTANKSIRPLRIPLILTGHIHNQDLFNRLCGGASLNISAPQLFSDKNDLLGYSIINIENNEIINIEYRKWVNAQNTFLNGIDFSGNNEGIVYINPTPNIQQQIHVDFEEIKKKFQDIDKFANDTISIHEQIENLKIVAMTSPQYKKEVFDLFIGHIRKRISYDSKERNLLEIKWLNANEKERLKTITSDIQLIFNILFKECKEIFKDYKANFRYTILSNAYLVGLSISNADFSYAFLSHATMYSSPEKDIYSEFINCQFEGAYMDAAHLSFSNFTGSTFTNSKLRWANLYRCNLKNVTFTMCDLCCAILSTSIMDNTFFKYCNLDGSENSNIQFSARSIFYKTSFCFASIFTEKMQASNSLVSLDDCDFLGAQYDDQYYEGFGRISRIQKYHDLITNNNLNIDKSCLYNKYKQILDTIKKYCISNNTPEEEKEIKEFLRE